MIAEGRPVAEILQDWTAGAARKVQYLYTDSQGSIVYRTEGTSSKPADGTNSTTGGFRGYQPYGKRWAINNEKPAFSSIGFTGHLHDDDLGLIYMNARVYDPEQMRFITRDPLSMPYALGGTNAYAYTLANPTNRTDPTGRSSVDGDVGDDDVTDGDLDEVIIRPCRPAEDAGCIPEIPEEQLCDYLPEACEPDIDDDKPLPGPGDDDEIPTIEDGDLRPVVRVIPIFTGVADPGACDGHPCQRGVLNRVNGVNFGDAYTSPPPAPVPPPPPPARAPRPPVYNSLDPSQYNFAQSGDVVRYIENNRAVFANYADGLINITRAMDNVVKGAQVRQAIWSSISEDVAIDGMFHPEHLRSLHVDAYEDNGYVPVPGDWLWDAGARFSGTMVGTYVGPWALEVFINSQAAVNSVRDMGAQFLSNLGVPMGLSFVP